MIIDGIEYGDLDSNKRYMLNKEAYALYYDDYFDKGAKTFNSWYGTPSHIKYISKILPQMTKLSRKLKLKKLNKYINDDEEKAD